MRESNTCYDSDLVKREFLLRKATMCLGWITGAETREELLRKLNLMVPELLQLNPDPTAHFPHYDPGLRVPRASLFQSSELGHKRLSADA